MSADPLMVSSTAYLLAGKYGYLRSSIGVSSAYDNFLESAATMRLHPDEGEWLHRPSIRQSISISNSSEGGNSASMHHVIREDHRVHPGSVLHLQAFRNCLRASFRPRP